MKIFDIDNGYWETKVNFVDENNVVVGYDLTQNCCEWAGWFLSYGEETSARNNDLDREIVETYQFDPQYFFTVSNDTNLDYGGLVRFRLVSEGKSDIFLHLFNSHNGYYSHGFSIDVGGIESRYGHI